MGRAHPAPRTRIARDKTDPERFAMPSTAHHACLAPLSYPTQAGRRPSRGHAGLRAVAMCLVLVLLCLEALPAQAQARAFARRYPAPAAQPVSTKGDILVIGNASMSCQTAETNCAAARSGGNFINNSFSMAAVDVDGLAATTNSSIATLNLPAGSTVLFAGLYWSAQSATGRNAVQFRTPGGSYATVTATTVDSIGNAYQSFANVTSQVSAAGSGAYTVGNIALTAGSNQWAGWTLVVAYQNLSTGTLRNLSVFDGFQLADGNNPQIDIAVSGFYTPTSGPVNSNVGLVTYDGDRGVQDSATANTPSLLFGPNAANLNPVFNAVNPVLDVFNSSISFDGNNVTAGRDPAYTNTLGVDIDVFQPNTPLPNGSNSALVRVRGSGGDVNYPGIITLATDVFEPNIIATFTKTETDVNGPPFVPGDVVQYSISLSNTGNDSANNVVITDALTSNVTFVPGSLVVVSGPNAGAKTDAPNDDQAGISGNTITFNAGTGATGTAGGTITPAPGASSATELTFRVRINDNVADGAQITNVANISYVSATTGIPGSASSPPSTITVSNQADLAITKTNATTTATSGATTTYSIVVNNAGPAPANGAVVRDPPAAGLTCAAVTCGAPTNGAVCPTETGAALLAALQSNAGVAIPTLPNAGSVTFTLTCTVQ